MIHDFCRIHLRLVMFDVRKRTTPEQRKAAWTYTFDHSNGEFHGPDDFYWYGSTCCKWDARSMGWMAWMAKMGFEDE